MGWLNALADRPLAAWLIDAVLGVMLAEWALLAWRHRRTRRAPTPGEAASAIAPGAALVLALRSARSFDGTAELAGLLLLAGGLHLWDLRHRWRR